MDSLQGFCVLNPLIMLIQYGPLCVALFFYLKKPKTKQKNELQGPPSVSLHPLAPISVKAISKDIFSSAWFAGK